MLANVDQPLARRVLIATLVTGALALAVPAHAEIKGLEIIAPAGVDIPTFKEQGVGVTLVNWRGLMAPAKMRPADMKALDAAMGEMVRTDEWQALLKERGWVDMYQPAEEFAAFLTPERTRIEGILRDVGLVQ